MLHLKFLVVEKYLLSFQCHCATHFNTCYCKVYEDFGEEKNYYGPYTSITTQLKKSITGHRLVYFFDFSPNASIKLFKVTEAIKPVLYFSIVI